MNTNILKKCVEELSKDAPRLDYVRGMLETLIEMNEVSSEDKIIPHKPPTISSGKAVVDKTIQITVPQQTDEAKALDAMAASKLATVMQATKLE